MTKIDIISGFLGAGKTTLIKKLLADALKGQKVVLIENEFGEIGIDGGFLKEAGIDIKEMNSGCICCSLVGDFGTALKDVVTQYQPDRIIIEPSGVGKLTDVIAAVQNVSEEAGLVVNSATTVVDVTKCKMYLKNFGEFFENQVEAAGTIVLSRMDTEKATQKKVDEAIGLLHGLNADATIITTPVENLSGEKVLETMEGVKIDLTQPSHEHEHHHDHEHHHEHDHHDDHDHGDSCGCGHDHHHHDHGDSCGCGHDHDADEVFTSWGKETYRKYTREELEEIMQELSDEDTLMGVVLRAKGMVESTEGEWFHFDLVPGEYEIRIGQPEYTGRLCVIGAQLREDKLESLFHLA
ncbi:MAG: GTP-binding protein [Lachnospiraceae bacterium]|nr:GTP-binding protein [Lachnospiraceae bacterium]